MLRLSMSVNPALALGMTQKLTSKGSAAFFMVIHYHLVMNGMIGYPIYQPIVLLQFHKESILMEFDSTGDLFCNPGGFSHSVESGAGKRRVFAIGNYVNQRLLRPLQPRNEAILLLYDHRLKLEDPPEIVLSLTYLDFCGSTNPRRDKSASDQASSQDRSNPPFKPTYKTSFH